jgi:hypothetical protein
MKTNHIALVVSGEVGSWVLIDTLSDEQEIEYFEQLMHVRDPDPLRRIYQLRTVQQGKEDEMADFIENLVSQPFVSEKVKTQGIRWFKSKIKIENFHQLEMEAAQVISEFAFKMFQKEPEKTDYFLVAPQSRIRVRVFLMR